MPPISPLGLEAVTRIDALFDIERTIRGETAARRIAVRREQSASLVAELEAWMRTERAGLSRHAAVAKAMDYMLKRWDGFAPLPRRRSHLSHKLRRREGAQAALSRTQVLAVRGLRSWRRAGGDGFHGP